MMLSELEAIKHSFEVLKMTPDEIAADRELEVGAVKAALMQCSGQYRRACGHEEGDEDKLNFTDVQLANVNEGIYNMAMYAEDEHLKLKALTYIRDDKKGRRDTVKQLANGPQFNVLVFNEQMAKIRDVATKAKERFLGGNGNGHNSKLIEA